MKTGYETRIDCEYIRLGVVNIFMVTEPFRGKRFTEVTEFKIKKGWAIFVKRIDNELYPKVKKITMVRDNFKAHTPSAFYKTLEPSEAKRLWDKFEFVYTPRHGSWLNMAEIELHLLTGNALTGIF